MVLAKFKSEQNAALLRSMMSDPSTAEFPWPKSVASNSSGKWHATPYTIRQVAFSALEAWGAAPADPVLAKPDYPATYLGRQTLIVIAGTSILLGLLVLLRGWIGSHASDRLVAGLSGVSLLLLFMFAGLSMRSIWRIDDLNLSIGKDRRYELASLRGDIRLLRMENVQDQLPSAYTSVKREKITDSAWEPTSSYNSRRAFAGFVIDGGPSPQPDITLVPYQSWSAPDWAICLPLSILPALKLRRWLRRRRRIGEGRCLQCGYDLRATPERCPECGAVRAIP